MANEFKGYRSLQISLLKRLTLLTGENRSSRQQHIDAEQFAVFGFVRHEDQWHNSSRDIDAEQFAAIEFVGHADQWHNSSRDIDAEQFAAIVFGQHADQWHNSSRDIDVEQFAEYYSLQNTRSVAQFLERYRC